MYRLGYTSVMIYKLSLLILLLTLPLLPSTPIAGLPLWAWASLSMSFIYALVLIYHIQVSWDETDG